MISYNYNTEKGGYCFSFCTFAFVWQKYLPNHEGKKIHFE